MNDSQLIDCWNTIGVWGHEKPRCPELDHLTHCTNCPVYSAAGRQLLNRPLDDEYLDEWRRILSQPVNTRDEDSTSALIFRLGDEWFGINTSIVREITYCSKHHSLPHRKNPVLRGIVSVRGDILLCVSLGYLFGLHKSMKQHEEHVHIHERYVVISDDEDTYTFPASEIRHIAHYNENTLESTPSTLNSDASSYIRGIFQYQDANVGLIDHTLLFHSLHRNI